MRRSYLRRLTAWVLSLAMIVPLLSSHFAAAAEMGNDGNLLGESSEFELVDADVEISREMADQLAAGILGDTSGGGVKTEDGYQYEMPQQWIDAILKPIEEDRNEALDKIPQEISVSEKDSFDADNAEVQPVPPVPSPNELPADYVDNSNEALYEMLYELETEPQTFTMPFSDAASQTKVDLVFLIDSTGSMYGTIDSVKQNVASFARALANKGVTLRLGLIDFRDITVTEDGDYAKTTVHGGSSPWMNVSGFISALTTVTAWGGGDNDETPIDALGYLTKISWSSDAYKFAMLITDAGYKTNNTHGISGMSQMISLLRERDIQVSTVTNSYDQRTYGALAGGTGGIQANLYGSFGTLLLEYADTVIGSARPEQDYTLRVSDSATRLPVVGAYVTWSGGSGRTDTNGLIRITTRSNPINSVSISRSGYQTRTWTSVNLMSSGCIELLLTVDDELEEDMDVPVLKPSMFRDPAKTGGSLEGPVIELLGKKFPIFNKLPFSLDLDCFGGKVSICHDKDEKKYEVIIGRTFEGTDPDKDSSYWKEDYEKYSSLVKDFTGRKGMDVYNEFRKLRKAQKSKPDLLFPVDAYIGGYAEASYASTLLRLVEGGIVVGVSTKIPPLNAPIPAAPYIFIQITFALDAQGKLGLVNLNPIGKALSIQPVGKIQIAPNLTGTLNLGVPKLASVGGGLKGRLESEWVLTSPNAFTVHLIGSFVFKLKLLGFEANADIPFGEGVGIQIYPWKGLRTNGMRLAEITEADFVPIARPEPVSMLADDGGNFMYQKTGVYADSAPQIARLNDNSWLLVWIDAAPETARADSNMTALYYSVSTDGSNWSDPKMVSDDGTGDYMPSLAVMADGTPVVVWQNCKKPYESMPDLEEHVRNIDISVAVFDTKNKTFRHAVALTGDENTDYETSVRVEADDQGVSVYWLVNNEQNPFLTSGTNTLWKRSGKNDGTEWSGSEKIAENLSYLTGFTAGQIGSETVVAFAEEKAGCISVITGDGKKTISTAGDPSSVQIVGGRLYWSDETGLHSWNGSATTEEYPDLKLSEFTVLMDTSSRALLIRQSTGVTNELYVSVNQGSSWTAPVPATGYGDKSLSEVSAVWADGSLYWACGRTGIDIEGDKYQFGTSDLVVGSYSTNDGSVVVGEEASITELNITPGQKIDVSLELTSQKLTATSNLSAKLFKDDTPIGESNLYVLDDEGNRIALTSIAAGKSLWAEVEYTPPAGLTAEHDLRVEIWENGTPCGSAKVKIPAPTADIVVEDVSVTRTDSGATITAIVRNTGVAAAENVELTLKEETEIITGITSYAAGDRRNNTLTLPPNESQTVTFTVSPDALAVNSPYVYKRFIVTAEKADNELSTSNNSDSVLLAPLSVEHIAVDGETEITLNPGGTRNLTCVITPSGVPDNSVTWMSNNTAIATVDEKSGVVTAHSAGQAVITVMAAADDSKKDIVTVNVTGEASVGVNSVAVSPANLTLEVGAIAELTAAVGPETATNKEVQWISATPELIEIISTDDNDRVSVKALASGTASVDVVTKDGAYRATAVITIPGDVLPPSHTHMWAAEWTTNETHHWHECEAEGCTITEDSGKEDYGAHVYDNDGDTTCNTCEYERIVTPPEHEHAWSDTWENNGTHHWHECEAEGCTVTENSQKDSYGTHVYDDAADTTCNTCGYVRTVTSPEHEHAWSDTWENNGTHHWHECKAEGCTVTEDSGKKDYGAHDYDNDEDTTCNTCGYERTVTPPEHEHAWASAWSKDATHHWHECKAEDCTVTEDSGKEGYAAHVYDNDEDSTCNTCGYTRTVGGGSSSTGDSSSSDTTTSTTKNPDGSTTTKTENKTTGTVTETTKRVDGSQTKVVIKKDGTVTTTETDKDGNRSKTVAKSDGSSITKVKQKDGTTATVNTDAAGKTRAEVNLTAAAVTEAQKEEKPVALPIPEVAATKSAETAPVVTVNTNSKGDVKVEIPVSNATPGTVAVIVKADGSEEVIKTSIVTQTGVAAVLPDGATVKIVDKNKRFKDVPVGNWAADAVSFNSARELFSGTSETTFAPEVPMTRAMLATVLARLDGEETNGGRTWYEKGVNWAVENGISDGSYPNNNITREQLAVMLWRYSGRPAATNKELNFSDAKEASGYALDALRWAVENGIINGYGDGRLSPKGQATRAEVAQMLKNYLER